MLAFATGGLGLKPVEFWRLTWAEYEVMCDGYAKEQNKRYRETWETVRWSTFHLVNIHIAKKDKLKRLTDLVRFPWDEVRNYEPSTREEFDRLCKLWGKTLA